MHMPATHSFRGAASPANTQAAHLSSATGERPIRKVKTLGAPSEWFGLVERSRSETRGR